MLRLIFNPRCKLDSLSDCLEIYYKYLYFEIDVHSIVSHVKGLFLLYNKYVKFYDLNLNVNIQQDVLPSQAPSTRIGKGYQLLFQ